jgi:23S rRNA (adenine2503-C2)-methyltransferase
MGMGEPMANFKEVSTAIEMLNKKYGLAYKRITLSTSCVNLDKLLDVKYHVAISLHTPFDDVRKKIIPGAMPIVKIMQFVKKYCDSRKFGVMIEYALMSGVNDRDEDIEALLKLDWPKNVFFNMIQYNDLGEFKRSDKLEYFKDKIRAAGYKCFIRLSRGADIEAACGMLDVE